MPLKTQVLLSGDQSVGPDGKGMYVPIHIHVHVAICGNMSVYLHVHVRRHAITVSETKYTGLERGSKQSTVLVALVYETVYCHLLGRPQHVPSTSWTGRPPRFRPTSDPHIREESGVHVLVLYIRACEAIQSGSPVSSLLSPRYSVQAISSFSALSIPIVKRRP